MMGGKSQTKADESRASSGMKYPLESENAASSRGPAYRTYVKIPFHEISRILTFRLQEIRIKQVKAYIHARGR